MEAREKVCTRNSTDLVTQATKLGTSIGMTFGTCGERRTSAASRPQVYQALSTRKGGEVLSADQY